MFGWIAIYQQINSYKPVVTFLGHRQTDETLQDAYRNLIE